MSFTIIAPDFPVPMVVLLRARPTFQTLRCVPKVADKTRRAMTQPTTLPLGGRQSPPRLTVRTDIYGAACHTASDHYRASGGEPRMLPLIYGKDGSFIIVASKGGHAHHSAWYLNLEATRTVGVQVAADNHRHRGSRGRKVGTLFGR